MVEIDLSYTGATPVSPCPNCGSVLDRTTGPAGGPEPGDATICTNCHHFCVFDEALKLRQPTTEEMKKMAGDRRFVALINALAKVKARDQATSRAADTRVKVSSDE